VQKAVVVVREDEPDNKRLVAYVMASTTQFSSSDLRRSLKQTLPEYMVPATFVMVDTLPLTHNGKVDRRALPMPGSTHCAVADTHVSPQTPIEELLAEIWQKLLKVEHLSVHDNFFALGGHSLLATQVVTRLRNILELDIPLRTLFEQPTVAQLAREIETQLAITFPDGLKDEL
jgi:acyl carrier protein